jgi:hypothetical protein
MERYLAQLFWAVKYKLDIKFIMNITKLSLNIVAMGNNMHTSPIISFLSGKYFYYRMNFNPVVDKMFIFIIV